MKPWLLAVGISLVVHGALFIALPPSSPSPPAVERVERGDQFITFTAVTSAASPPVHPERSRGAPSPLVPVLTVSSPLDPRSRNAPSTPLGVIGGSPEVAGEGVREVEETGEQGATALTPTLSPAGEREAGGGVDVTALVHDRLAAVADRCYPAAARRFQQRGTVQLSFCTDANGGAASTAITQSSGAELLDAAARGCVVESAAPFPLEAASRCFSVPVRFGAPPR